MMTFLDLQNRVLRWIDEVEDVNITRRLVKDAINASQKRVLASRAWPFLKYPGSLGFTTVSGVRAYALSPLCAKLLTVYDPAQQRFVPVLPRANWPETGVANGRTDTVRPYGVIPGTMWPVSAQPTAASTITLVSASNSDLGGPSVYLEGVDASGTPVSETVTLTGTTPVTSVGAYLYVTNLAKQGTWAGTLTVAAGSTTLVTILSNSTGYWYPTIEFVEPPTAGIVFSYTFQRSPREMNLDGDIPDIPMAFSEILVYDALLDLSTYNTELGATQQVIWKSRVDAIKEQMMLAAETQFAGASPRTVRDLDAGDLSAWWALAG